MKHIKIFEDFTKKLRDLREFTEDYLVNGYGKLEWNRLKNNFIPFLYMLEREYSVINIGLGINSEVPTKYNLSDIDSEKFKIKTLFFINITLK